MQAAIAEAKAAAGATAAPSGAARSTPSRRVRYRRAMLSSWQLLRPGDPPTPPTAAAAGAPPAADVAATPEAAAALKARASEVAKAEDARVSHQLGEMRKSEGLGAPRADVGDAFGGVLQVARGVGAVEEGGAPPARHLARLAEARVGRLRTVCAAADVSSFDDLQRWLREVRGTRRCRGPTWSSALCQLLGVGHERRSEALRPPFPPMVWESVREEAGAARAVARARAARAVQ